MPGPDYAADLNDLWPTDAWDPIPGALCRRRSDGELGIWNGSAWVLVSSLGGGGGGGAVSSVHGRTGDVVAEPTDYVASMIQNDAGMPPGAATVADALAQLHARVEALEMMP